MGKTFETKKRILGLLRNRNMTVSELSERLGLSSATVSQHMDELREMGAVEKLENEHFRKMKYYKINEGANMNMAKYAIGALVVVALLSALYIYTSRQRETVTPPLVVVPNVSSNSTGTTGTPNATVPPIGGGGAMSCPMITYTLNGSVAEYTGLVRYTLNSSTGPVYDYVTGHNTTSVLNVTEKVGTVLDSNVSQLVDNRSHYAYLAVMNSTFGTVVQGINVTIFPKTYDARTNATLTFAVELDVANATQGTYWLRIDGPCGGGISPALLTVGNEPYNGTIKVNAAPYA